MTWSDENINKARKLYLTIFWDCMCDKIKNEPCSRMARFKGYSMKIPKNQSLFIDYHNFIIRVIP